MGPGGAPPRRAGAGPEDVRVSSDELVGDGGAHVADVEAAVLALDLALKHNLEQQVAELLMMLVGAVAAAVGVERGQDLEHLVRLLEEVGAQRLDGLLVVPGTAAGPAQARHGVAQGEELFGGVATQGRHRCSGEIRSLSLGRKPR